MHLFLSPHFDDAVYSCGGTIYHLTQQATPVQIYTAMAAPLAPPVPDTPITRDLHARWGAGADPTQTRRGEDQAAAAAVGASVAFGPLQDCVYRTGADGAALYPDENSLWETVHADDRAPIVLRDMGTGWLSGVTTLYAPLAVGQHVDHIVVRDWALWLSEQVPGVAVRFYFDYPYMENQAAVRAAQSRLLGLLDGRAVAREAVHLTADDIAAKIRGVLAHRSQLSTFWRDETEAGTRVRAALDQFDGRPAEHYLCPVV